MTVETGTLADEPTNLGSGPIELIFLGTGTSTSLPHVECLTAPPDGKQCRTCLSTLTSEGKHNIRRNTSVAVRVSAKDGRKVTIVVDAGKNFQAAALEWFPKYGLRQIDALLITHAHADAMNGLDDLRAWTLNEAIQSHIDVYLSQATFEGVQRSFPYLVAKEFASGGGDVPEFRWHIIEDVVPFEILDTGIQVTPIAVHHGRIFSIPPPLPLLSTPAATTPAATTPSATTPSTPTRSSTPSKQFASGHHKPLDEVINPYWCFGFKFGHEIVYMSDVSYIPDDKWAIIQCRPQDLGPLPVLVLDCLRLRPHTSHVGLGGSMDIARKIAASRTYLTGFSHDVAHDDLVILGEAAGGKWPEGEPQTETVENGLKLLGNGENIWMRPAHDGLRVCLEGEGRVSDGSYY